MFRGIICAAVMCVALRVAAAAAGAGWTSAALPDMPLGISVHRGAFWVCGANEMVARSSDGGQTWTVLHAKPGSEMLFSLVFWPDGRDIDRRGARAACGRPQPAGSGLPERRLAVRGQAASLRAAPLTESRRLRCQPAPEQRAAFPKGKPHSTGPRTTLYFASLSSQPAAGRLSQFRGSRAGFARGANGATRSHWRFNFAAAFGPEVIQLAVRDAVHAALLLDPGPAAPEQVLITSDGGAHWRVYPQSAKFGWAGIRAVAQGYRLWGREGVLGRRCSAATAPRAYGTAGVRVSSRDGGATWREGWMAPARGLSQVQFANRTIGYGYGPAGFAMTHDGGRNWTFWNVTAKNEWNAVVGMAVEGENDALFLVGGNRLAITRDGGRSWHEMAFGGKAQWTGLGTVDGKYKLYGEWEGQAGRAAAQPSRAGTGIAAVPWDNYNCNAQGCLVTGGWADRSGGHWAWPEDAADPLTGGWAVEGDVSCRVSAELRCRRERAALAPPKAVATEPGAFKRLCVHCPAPAFPRCHGLRGCFGGVLLKVLIGVDGRVEGVIVLGADGVGLARAASDAVRKWRYSKATGAAGREMTSIVRMDFHRPLTNEY